MIKLFVPYLFMKKKSVILLLICMLIFSVVFYLSDIELAAVLYGGLLCLIIIAIFGIYDFFLFYHSHKALSRLISTIDSQIDLLPEPKDILARDYTEIIKALHAEKRSFESKTHIEKMELMDYFTLWTHQIKTPIAAMGLLLQPRGVKQLEQGKALTTELFNIEEYVNNALSYIRLGDISSDMSFESVELDSVIRKALRKYSPIFIGKRIKVEFQKTEMILTTDQKWLLIVLGQVLSNGLKYTNENGNILIYLDKNDLVIEDSGIGIPPEDMSRIFEKGFTGSNGRQYSKSTGLGLYLCKLIMNKLGYRIAVASEVGKGTKIMLDFSE